MKKVVVIMIDGGIYPYFIRSDTFERLQEDIDPKNKSGWREKLAKILEETSLPMLIFFYMAIGYC